MDLQITFFDAKLALLLNIAQTRFGATAVFDAGLFQAVKSSGLFSTDPDLGVGKFNSSSTRSIFNQHRCQCPWSRKVALWITFGSDESPERNSIQ